MKWNSLTGTPKKGMPNFEGTFNKGILIESIEKIQWILITVLTKKEQRWISVPVKNDEKT